MIPSSTIRETLILILFGIILVPIAAKRAQDTRGYWQSFQLQDLTTPQSSSSSSSSSSSPSYEHAPLVVVEQHDVIMAQNDSSLPPAIYVPSRAQQPLQVETRIGGGGRTIRFGSGAATTTAAAAAGEALATVAPPPPPRISQQRGKTAPGHTKDEELPAAAKASDASSKGRWTLVWMGSAIAAVAVLMSFC